MNPYGTLGYKHVPGSEVVTYGDKAGMWTNGGNDVGQVWTDIPYDQAGMYSRSANIGGKDYLRLGTDPQSYLRGMQHTNDVTRFNLDNFGAFFDPTYGWVAPAENTAGMEQQQSQLTAAQSNGGILEGLMSHAPIIMGTAGMGAAIGGGFSAAEAGAAAGEGATAGGASFAADSPYWTMGAENLAGGTATDAAAVGAGSVGTDYTLGTAGAGYGGAGSSSYGLTAPTTAGMGSEYGLTGVGTSTGLTPTNALGSTFGAGTLGVGGEGAGTAAIGGAVNTAGGGFDFGKLFTPSNLLTAGSNIGSALIQSRAIKNATQAQIDSTNSSNALLRDMYLQNRADLEPWRTSGVNALATINKLTTPGNQLNQAMLDPGYAFRQSEGEQAINRAASARGLYNSGGTMKALDRYNQDYATGEFGNVFNRLSNVAGLGQTATNTGINASQNYGSQVSNNLIGAGSARASGYVGGANALTGSATNYLNYTNQNALLDRMIAAGAFKGT